MYETPEDMEKVIDAYFSECDTRTRDVVTKQQGVVTMRSPEPYTMAGICHALGFSREAWREYHAGDHGPGFVEVTEAARQRVEYDMERRLYDRETFTVGLIFGLKNHFGWTDNHEITGAGGGPIVVKFDGQDAKL